MYSVKAIENEPNYSLQGFNSMTHSYKGKTIEVIKKISLVSCGWMEKRTGRAERVSRVVKIYDINILIAAEY